MLQIETEHDKDAQALFEKAQKINKVHIHLIIVKPYQAEHEMTVKYLTLHSEHLVLVLTNANFYYCLVIFQSKLCHSTK